MSLISYIGSNPLNRVDTQNRNTYVATAGQTIFAATYTPGYVDVYKQGIKLRGPTGFAFTAIDGNTVVLASGATAGDIIDIVAIRASTPYDFYTKSQADFIHGNFYAVAGGTSDALSLTLNPLPTSLPDGIQFKVMTVSANATTTPSATISNLGLAKAITGPGGIALKANAWAPNQGITLRYNLAGDRFEFLEYKDTSFTQPGTGAVVRTAQDKMRESVSFKDYGVAEDNVTDDTSAIQRVINLIGAAAPFDGTYPAIELSFSTKAKVYIAGTVYIPSFVHINLNGAVLRGSGTNTMFESGYWSGGSVVSNFGQANETQFVVGSKVHNGNILNCNKAFHLFNFCESSQVENIRMVGVNQAIYAKRCFYGLFNNIMSRGPLDGTILPCYHFDDEVNAISLNSLFAGFYTVGWKFSGAKRNVIAINCSSESCPTGVSVNDSTAGIKFLGWYFENCYNAIDCVTDGNHSNVTVDDCWFYSVTNAIQGSTILSGEFKANNSLNGAALNLPSNYSPRFKVEIPPDSTVYNATPILPTTYILGDGVDVEYTKQIYDSDGFVKAKGQIYSGPIPHSYSGDSGKPIVNQIPFCTATLTGTTLTVDTKINYRDSEFIGVSLRIIDGTVKQAIGFCVSNGILPVLVTSPLTLSPSNNGGYYRFTVSGLTAATSYAGSIRIL